MSVNMDDTINCVQQGKSSGDAASTKKENWQALQEHRKKLPVWSARKRLVKEVVKNDTVILMAETASGKTTQVPQFLYKAGIMGSRAIACTQPRRVAAITTAERVACEVGTQLGNIVGYRVRFDDMTSETTRIKYMTDGMLLREAVLDPLLTKYSVVILDEAHERTVHTDVLFAVVRKAQRKRTKSPNVLKVIVMSATMDLNHFKQYFKAPLLYIEGRQFNVEVRNSVKKQSDYVFASVCTVVQIHKQEPPNQDILVFLTGQEEIEGVVRTLRQLATTFPSDVPRLEVLPLYAAMSQLHQLRVFKPSAKGTRKVIVATNIAETSITIPGIKYVVDSGRIKAKHFHPATGMETLQVRWISQAQGWQRAGRAGRERDGVCYQVFTEQEFDSLPHHTIPEILRCSLSNVLLQLTAMGVSDVASFEFMDTPKQQAVEQALEELSLLGAVVKESDKFKLTELGREMAAFPVDPKLSRALVAAARTHSCLREMLTIVALSSVDSIVMTPPNKREQAAAVHEKFISADGDHLTSHNIFRAYLAAKGSKEWCKENFINRRNMTIAKEIKQQLLEIATSLDLPLQSCGEDKSRIRKSLATGLFLNAAELSQDGTHFTTVLTRKRVAPHPSSALFQRKPSCVVFTQLVHTSQAFMRDVTSVDHEWLQQTAPELFKKTNATSR